MATKRSTNKNNTIKSTNAKDSLFGLGGNDELIGESPPDRRIRPGSTGLARPSQYKNSVWLASASNFAAVDTAREFCLPARCQDARLFHPVLALDPAFEVEQLAHPIDIGAGPIGNLLISRDGE